VGEFCSTKTEFDHDSGTEKQFVDTVDHAKVRSVVEYSYYIKSCDIFHLNVHQVTKTGFSHDCLLCNILTKCDEVKFLLMVGYETLYFSILVRKQVYD